MVDISFIIGQIWCHFLLTSLFQMRNPLSLKLLFYQKPVSSLQLLSRPSSSAFNHHNTSLRGLLCMSLLWLHAVVYYVGLRFIKYIWPLLYQTLSQPDALFSFGGPDDTMVRLFVIVPQLPRLCVFILPQSISSLLFRALPSCVLAVAGSLG